MLLRKYTIKRYFIFQPQLTNASALPGEMKKGKIPYFHSMLYCCIARLQPVTGLIYSVLLLATHAHAAI